ncbi:Adenosylhomocysteinase [Thelohanellus kitauei]|uniref:Adenosylhomocysteinase n=1 Tax=Thelohanellus kitauei TaxID=669202 RepID=A0A0C2J6D2_THEKT|nr:Adenosylhomocysteinase [Thelohanellus kitauei]
MDLRKEYAKDKVLKGSRIAGCSHVTFETAVLIETLVECGAEVRWCSCDVLSTSDYAAAALAKAGIPVFAWKGETQEEFEWCQEKTLKFKDGPLTLLIEDRGYITARLHEKYPQWLDGIKGIVNQYTVGIMKIYKLLIKGELKVPVFDCNQSATKSKFDHIYGCRESLVDGIKRATNVQIAGKICVVCGYTDNGKGVAQSLRGYGARVIITEHDPILALQAAMEGYQVSVLDDVISDADIVISATSHIQVVTGEHIAKMKDHAIIGNMGQYDPECDVDWIVKNAVSHIRIKPQTN